MHIYQLTVWHCTARLSVQVIIIRLNWDVGFAGGSGETTSQVIQGVDRILFPGLMGLSFSVFPWLSGGFSASGHCLHSMPRISPHLPLPLIESTFFSSLWLISLWPLQSDYMVHVRLSLKLFGTLITSAKFFYSYI